jgi:hypothetical protein
MREFRSSLDSNPRRFLSGMNSLECSHTRWLSSIMEVQMDSGNSYWPGNKIIVLWGVVLWEMEKQANSCSTVNPPVSFSTTLME